LREFGSGALLVASKFSLGAIIGGAAGELKAG
jgi:hypothetical protein